MRQSRIDVEVREDAHGVVAPDHGEDRGYPRVGERGIEVGRARLWCSPRLTRGKPGRWEFDHFEPEHVSQGRESVVVRLRMDGRAWPAGCDHSDAVAVVQTRRAQG